MWKKWTSNEDLEKNEMTRQIETSYHDTQLFISIPTLWISKIISSDVQINNLLCAQKEHVIPLACGRKVGKGGISGRRKMTGSISQGGWSRNLETGTDEYTDLAD